MIKSTLHENSVAVMSRHHDEDDNSRECFWAEDPLVLVTDFTLIPRAKMSLAEKMNVITRIVIIVWILLLIVKYKHATVFFLATLLIIVLVYYSRKRHEERVQRILERLDHSSERYSVRGENPKTSQWITGNDGVVEFTRFEAKAGNRMADISATPSEKSHAVENPAADHERLKDLLTLKKTLKRQEKIEKQERKLQKEENKLHRKTMRKKNQEEELVRAQRSEKPEKRDPRRPWPPTVPFSMEVKSGHPGKGALDEQRQLNLRRSHLGGPRPNADSKFHGYHAEAFQDESGEESDDQEYERQEVEAAQEVVEPIKPIVTKRTFLPSNYDVAQDKTPAVKNEGPKMTRHGAARARRVPKWNDNNEIKPLHDASEMQFTRAARLEQRTNSKGRANNERQSQVHSLFG